MTGLLLIAATSSADLPAEPVTAIDVLLLPDQTMIDRAQAANARLRENYPAGFALDATHHPHISLLQRYVRTKDLDAVYAAVGKVLNKERPAGWQLEATGYFYVIFNGMGLPGIVVQPTPELLRLQQEVIDAVAPYTVPDGTSAAFVTTPDSPDVNASTMQYVKTFIPERNGKKLQPARHGRRRPGRFRQSDESRAIRQRSNSKSPARPCSISATSARPRSSCGRGSRTAAVAQATFR